MTHATRNHAGALHASTETYVEINRTPAVVISTNTVAATFMIGTTVAKFSVDLSIDSAITVLIDLTILIVDGDLEKEHKKHYPRSRH
jgi:hypothetical protein